MRKPNQPGDRVFEIGEHWISKRPDAKGGWQRTWYDKKARQTRRVSLGTADLEEAKLIMAGWVLKNETMVDEDPAVVPLATVLMR